MDATVEVRHLHQLEEFARCIELEQAVWGSAYQDVVPLALFVVAAETGGQVLGAFAGQEMMGFTLALAAWHERPGAEKQLFLHSHMTAVLEEYRNRGIGRQLKLFQRADALARGIRLVEWTFDPLETKNAHFNLVRLGAVARRFIPNCYGITTSPLHGGLPTDRLVAEWWVGSPRVRRIVEPSELRQGLKPAPKAGEMSELRLRPPGEGEQLGGRETKRILVPRELGELKAKEPREALRVQARVREEFQKWFAQGFVATAIEPVAPGSEYVLEAYAAVRSELDASA
jgi:predicted GNAT superfamily acetyltransferase